MTVRTHRTVARYRAYGTILSSNKPIPELGSTPFPNPEEDTDLHVLFVSTDDDIPSPGSWYQTVSLPDGTPWLRSAKIGPDYLMEFPDLASFVFTPSHNLIRCIPCRKIPPPTLHHLLLDQVFPLWLNYRGREVFHGAAVVTPYGSCAFVGPTGSGKSTLAASFLTSGYSVLADDCVVLETDSDNIVTIPSYPGLRLWDDAIAALFGTTGRVTPVAHYTPKQRFHAAVSESTFHPSSVPLAGIYVLETRAEEEPPAPSAQTMLLRTRDALMALLSVAFKLDITDQQMLTREFDFLHRLVTQIPVRRLVIPNSFDALPEVRASILQDLSHSC